MTTSRLCNGVSPTETNGKDDGADTKVSCPFEPKRGWATTSARRDYIKFFYENNDNSNGDADKNNCNSNNHNATINKEMDSLVPKSLVADPDTSKPLYFWQLYSLIGHKPMFDIVNDFYTRVYNDREEPWFRDAFTSLASKEHHIATQVMYWVDAMGGGKVYHGGDFRLRFHHEHNAGKVMTAKGAKRWMYHMRNAMNGYNFDALKDPRIKPCIMDFLKMKMSAYSEQHHWEFDPSDF